jgi:hypothetical protein
MAIAPLHIYRGDVSGNGTWQLNPFYTLGENGERYNEDQAYDRYRRAREIDSPASAPDTSQDKMFSYLDKAADKAFGYQERTMARTNEYRTKEGATQGQMDDRAFQRLSAELETRKYMQTKGQDLTNWQRDQDQKRAITSFKTIG